jgi:hypothetical protein
VRTEQRFRNDLELKGIEVSRLDAHLDEGVSSSPIRYTSEWFEKKKDSTTRLND